MFSQPSEFLEFAKKIDNSFKIKTGGINYLEPYVLLGKESKKSSMTEQIKYQYYSYLHKKMDKSLFSLKELTDLEISFNNAKEEILGLTNSKKIVMFNEQHHNPFHRLYVTTFLSELKRQGYNVLALETLSWKDEELNVRKFPIAESGVYTVEPYFANLVRVALELGYEVLPYERRNTKDGTINGREEAQANNLVKIYNMEKGKILVLAGYSHIAEVPIPSGHQKGESIWMAARLKKKLNIDPLTIDQTQMSNDSRVNQISIPYMNNESFMLPKFKGRYDFTVIYPKNLDYLHRELGKACVKVRLHKRFVSKNQLIQFYVKTEYEAYKDKAIPYEQFLIDSTEMSVFLNPKRIYKLIVRDSDYKVLVDRLIDTFEKISIK